MNKFARELGFFIISIFLVSIPFLTGVRLGAAGELEWFTVIGLMLSFMEIGILTGVFLYLTDDLLK